MTIVKLTISRARVCEDLVNGAEHPLTLVIFSFTLLSGVSYRGNSRMDVPKGVAVNP
jgi:hypothetical protein